MNIFKIILSSFLCLFCVNTNAQSPQEQFLAEPDAYFEQNPPGNTPEEFGGTVFTQYRTSNSA